MGVLSCEHNRDICHWQTQVAQHTQRACFVELVGTQDRVYGIVLYILDKASLFGRAVWLQPAGVACMMYSVAPLPCFITPSS